MKWQKYVTWHRVTKNKVVEEYYRMMFLKAFFSGTNCSSLPKLSNLKQLRLLQELSHGKS